MLFKPEMIDAILAGKKTQTRRVMKESETYYCRGVSPLKITEVAYHVATTIGYWQTKWRVGQSYAIQPGRGKGGIYARLAMSGKHEWQTTQPDGNGGAQWKPMRIRVTDIRRERLQDISEADAQAEGVNSIAEYRELWERINGAGSWETNPEVWVLTFELVEGGEAAQ